MQFIDFRGSLRAVDRHGYCRFRANQDVKGTAARGAEGALDILICSEKGWPLRSTAFLELSYVFCAKLYRGWLLQQPSSSHGSIDSPT
jgi:hypothetical protein